MKVLLIDDNASKGWKQVLEKIFPIIDVTSCETTENAIEEIQKPFDFIFLDVRLTSDDHFKNDVNQYSGFKVLQKIKNDFLNINFSTPIILLTASNKIWNIEAFRKQGVDSFYIKEHPDYVFDQKTSKENLQRLKKSFLDLVKIGENRKKVWENSVELMRKLEDHYYFKEDKRYVNVKNRINDKLKLGYNYLFKSPTDLEKEVLNIDNESLSFIIYWSIFEEVIKGFTDFNHSFTDHYKRNENWKFMNSVFFIEAVSSGYKINYFYNYKNQSSEKDSVIDEKTYSARFNKNISLSDQMYSLIWAYGETDADKNKLITKFKDINRFRNKIDFIHSDIKNIYSENLLSKKESEKAFTNILIVLEILNELLDLP